MCEPCFPLVAPAEAPVVLEKGVRIVTSPRRTGPPPKYPFWKMKKGESFFVPATGEQKDAVRHKLGTIGRRNAAIDGTKFTVRTVEGGVRVWRVA